MNMKKYIQPAIELERSEFEEEVMLSASGDDIVGGIGEGDIHQRGEILNEEPNGWKDGLW